MLAIPSGPEWKADFGMSLAGLIAYSATPLRNGDVISELKVHNVKGSILSRSRQKLVEQAVEGGFTHVLFLDSDQTFPAQTLHHSLMREKAVVACNIATKMLPSTPTARMKSDEKAGRPLYVTPDDMGILRVWRVGTGIMLIAVDVFRKMPKPWFEVLWDEELQDYRGEDWVLCEKFDELGIPIYVDLTLSRVIGHVGEFTFKHEHVEQKK